MHRRRVKELETETHELLVELESRRTRARGRRPVDTRGGVAPPLLADRDHSAAGESGRRSDVRVDFAEIIVRANPESARALVALGAWQTVAGETARAKASLRKATAASPDDAMAHWRMGELLEQDGESHASRAAATGTCTFSCIARDPT